MAKKKPLRYWYICHIYYCPVCGRERSTRERTTTKHRSYYQYHEGYDYCLEREGLG